MSQKQLWWQTHTYYSCSRKARLRGNADLMEKPSRRREKNWSRKGERAERESQANEREEQGTFGNSETKMRRSVQANLRVRSDQRDICASIYSIGCIRPSQLLPHGSIAEAHRSNRYAVPLTILHPPVHTATTASERVVAQGARRSKFLPLILTI